MRGVDLFRFAAAIPLQQLLSHLPISLNVGLRGFSASQPNRRYEAISCGKKAKMNLTASARSIAVLGLRGETQRPRFGEKSLCARGQGNESVVTGI